MLASGATRRLDGNSRDVWNGRVASVSIPAGETLAFASRGSKAVVWVAPFETLAPSSNSAVSAAFADTFASLTKYSCRMFADLGLSSVPAPGPYRPAARNAPP